MKEIRIVEGSLVLRKIGQEFDFEGEGGLRGSGGRRFLSEGFFEGIWIKKELNSEEIKFIKEAFKWALFRMEELPIENWGTYEIKAKRIRETKEEQDRIINKLIAKD